MGQSGHLLTTWTVVAAWDECQSSAKVMNCIATDIPLSRKKCAC